MKISSPSLMFLGFALGGCASLSSYQEARVLEKGQGHFGISYTGYGDDLKKSVLNDTTDGSRFNLFGVSGRFGVWDNLEVGVNYTFLGAITGDAKYQLLGRDSASTWQFSAGLKGGYASLETKDANDDTQTDAVVVDMIVPVYVGWTPQPWLGVTLAPEFCYRISENELFYPSGPIAGANIDLRLGRRITVVGEFGYHRHLDKDYSLMNYGASVQFPLEFDPFLKMIGM